VKSTQVKKVESILAEVLEWAVQSAAIAAASLVGSWARGTARKDSDIDFWRCRIMSHYKHPEKL
jgi:predicted nucleotidyltransferase